MFFKYQNKSIHLAEKTAPVTVTHTWHYWTVSTMVSVHKQYLTVAATTTATTVLLVQSSGLQPREQTPKKGHKINMGRHEMINSLQRKKNLNSALHIYISIPCFFLNDFFHTYVSLDLNSYLYHHVTSVEGKYVPGGTSNNL